MKALITGATSGIGRDIAVVLSKMGCDLILASRNMDKMKQVKKKLEAMTDGETEIRLIQADLSTLEDCMKLYDRVKDEDIDILVNNAGFGAFGTFSEIPLAQEMNMLDLNVRAVHVLTKLFLADFKARDFGYILNVASAAGFMPGPLMATYYATKNYVLRLTEAIYEELRHEGSRVHISALCPGPVKTGFNKRARVEFAISGLASSRVAQAGVGGMFRGDMVIIPGATMQIGNTLQKFLPESWLVRIAYYIQHKKSGKAGGER